MTHDFTIFLQLETARKNSAITPADEIFTVAWLNDRYELKNKFSPALSKRVDDGQERAERVMFAAQMHGSAPAILAEDPERPRGSAPRTLLLMAGSQYYPGGAEDIISCLPEQDLDDAIEAAKKLVEGEMWIQKTFKDGRVDKGWADWALVYDLTTYKVLWQGGKTTANAVEDMPVELRVIVRPEGV